MTHSSDRLDRIEAILKANAQQLVETRQIVESNARAIESNARDIEARIAANEVALSTLRSDMAQCLDALEARVRIMKSQAIE